MKTESLNLFFGQVPSGNFLDDLDDLIVLDKKEVNEIIDHILDWYPKEDIEEEWEKWKAGLSENEVEKKQRVLRLLLFIMKEIAAERISEKEITEDLENLDFPKEYSEYILKNLKSADDFKKKALKEKRPYENTIRDIDWRVDNRNYLDGTEQKIIVLEVLYSSKGEKETITFDLNKKALKHLITVLRKIEDSL